MSERMIWDALDEGRDPTEPDNRGAVTGSVLARLRLPFDEDHRGHASRRSTRKGVRRLMSSATVLDSIIEGVRADVAAREAVVSLAEIKELPPRPPRRRWT